jgi:transposase
VFGVRLPRALTLAFIDNALKGSQGIAGLSVAMRGLIAARTAAMTAVAAIDADMRRMTRASAACRRLMTIPGVGKLTALAFVAAIDDPSRIRRSRDFGAYFGLVPRCRHISSSDNADVSYFNAIGTGRSFEKVHLI